MKNRFFKLAILILLMTALVAFFVFDLGAILTLENIKNQHSEMHAYYVANRFFVIGFFFLLYVIVTAFSLPLASLLTLLSGALFGFTIGLIVASFASTIGATLAFLMTRFLLKDFVQHKYGKYFSKINDGFEKEGIFYLFALRLVPVVPFFLVNILMALVPIKIRTFYLISQIGMLFGTAVYVYAGTELSKIDSLSAIASPRLLLAFALLGMLPLMTKKILNFLRKEK